MVKAAYRSRELVGELAAALRQAAAGLAPLPAEAMAQVQALYDERIRPHVHASW